MYFEFLWQLAGSNGQQGSDTAATFSDGKTAGAANNTGDAEMTYLFNKSTQELQYPLQSLFLHYTALQRAFSCEYTEHVDELVVECVVLGRKLCEKHPRKVGNPLVAVFETLGHLAELTLDLDLTSKDQECQCHKTGSLDAILAIIETSIQESRCSRRSGD